MGIFRLGLPILSNPIDPNFGHPIDLIRQSSRKTIKIIDKLMTIPSIIIRFSFDYLMKIIAIITLFSIDFVYIFIKVETEWFNIRLRPNFFGN